LGSIRSVFVLAFCLLQLGLSFEILGAGATLPMPLYNDMFDTYYRNYGIKATYQAVGSGSGIKEIINKNVDFGASDAYLSIKDENQTPAHLVHIPTCIGAVAIIFNLEGVTDLQLTPQVISEIYQRKILKWSDKKIAKLNPDVVLPDASITVVHRSDSSGTSFIFTSYLSANDSNWANSVGSAKKVNWPTGIGAKGNPGVVGMVKTTAGSIGYAELSYAKMNNMNYARVKNPSGVFIKPSVQSTTAAGSQAVARDTKTLLINSKDKDAYPIAGLSWILIYQEQKYDNRTIQQAKELVKLIWWMTHQAQTINSQLYYAPLPENIQKLAEEQILSIKYNGKQMFGKKEDY